MFVFRKLHCIYTTVSAGGDRSAACSILYSTLYERFGQDMDGATFARNTSAETLYSSLAEVSETGIRKKTLRVSQDHENSCPLFFGYFLPGQAIAKKTGLNTAERAHCFYPDCTCTIRRVLTIRPCPHVRMFAPPMRDTKLNVPQPRELLPTTKHDSGLLALYGFLFLRLPRKPFANVGCSHTPDPSAS